MCADKNESQTLAADAQERAVQSFRDAENTVVGANQQSPHDIAKSFYRPRRFDGDIADPPKQNRDEYGPLGPVGRVVSYDPAVETAAAVAARVRHSLIGPGGAPTRATSLDDTPAGRKRQPVASGVLDYFPDALVAIAEVSFAGNEQHNPGMSLRWTRGKSADESDALVRHFLQRGGKDTDGIRHSAKLAWRALALLQKEIEGVQ